jgi:hypothetical protein
MFFKTKKPDYAPQIQNRAPRYDSLALVRINGLEGYAVLRTVSTGGFLMESKTFVDIDAGSVHSIEITPESAAGIPAFKFEVKVCWVRSTAEKFSVGFQITHDGGRPLEKYIEFLKNRPE